MDKLAIWHYHLPHTLICLADDNAENLYKICLELNSGNFVLSIESLSVDESFYTEHSSICFQTSYAKFQDNFPNMLWANEISWTDIEAHFGWI